MTGGTTQCGEGAKEFILQVLVLGAVALQGLDGAGQRELGQDGLSLPVGLGGKQVGAG